MSDYPLDFTPQCPQVAWLAEHLGGWQFGEQDLLMAVMNKLEVFSEYADLFRCIEIGAGDGEELPLTIQRFYEAGTECLLFESVDKRRVAISKKYPLAKVDGAFYGQELPPSVLVVIDIDSHDSQIMQQVMKRDRPAVVVCEHMDRRYPIGTSAPLEKAYEWGKVPLVDRVLAAIKAAWPDDQSATKSFVITGVAKFFKTHPEADGARAAKAMAELSPNQILRHADDAKQLMGGNRDLVVSRVIAMQYNKRLKLQNRLAVATEASD